MPEEIDYHMSLQCNYFGSIDISNETFEARNEIKVWRRLTSLQVSNYLSLGDKFEPSFVLEVIPIGCVSIISHSLMEFNHQTSYSIELHDNNYYISNMVITLYIL